jgi:hypothetical protein
MDNTTSNTQNNEDGIEILKGLLQAPVGVPQKDAKGYGVLVRNLHRLDHLCKVLPTIEKDGLEAVNTAYKSIVSTVLANIGEDAGLEMGRLGLSGQHGVSVLETRIMLVQLHGWLENLVNSLELQHQTEQMLGMKLEDLVSGATLVPETPQVEAQRPRAAVGMYL